MRSKDIKLLHLSCWTNYVSIIIANYLSTLSGTPGRKSLGVWFGSYWKSKFFAYVHGAVRVSSCKPKRGRDETAFDEAECWSQSEESEDEDELEVAGTNLTTKLNQQFEISQLNPHPQVPRSGMQALSNAERIWLNEYFNFHLINTSISRSNNTNVHIFDDILLTPVYRGPLPRPRWTRKRTYREGVCNHTGHSHGVVQLCWRDKFKDNPQKVS